MGQKSRQKRERKRNASLISDHELRGKTLVPPFMKYPKTQLTSWTERFPEVLWAVLLITGLERRRALEVFRQVAVRTRQWSLQVEKERREIGRQVELGVGHSVLMSLPDNLSHELLSIICAEADFREALRPLLLFDDLPERETWAKAIGLSSDSEDWNRMKAAVARVLFHQTQEATDVRWLRVFFQIAVGRLHLPSNELIREIVEYPNFGDQRKVRPSIRSSEMSIDMMPTAAGFPSPPTWQKAFWETCLNNTSCEVLDGNAPDEQSQSEGGFDLQELRPRIVQGFFDTLETTEIDAEHDTVFGIALFCMSLVEELEKMDTATSISGRFVLRAILEALVTLAYLEKKDEQELWRSYRVFGAGQAKLALLKLDQGSASPNYVRSEDLEALANEDAWEEFLSIDLGHWAKSNLRSLAENAGVKEIYDRYYPWTSTYMHGHWAALRDSSFQTCLNPLHRLHRIPLEQARSLPNVLADAHALLQEVIAILRRLYPSISLAEHTSST